MYKILLAIQNAFNGLRYSFNSERNFKIEISCACITVSLGIYLKISLVFWLVIVLNICFVLVAELFNTAVEKLADVVCKEINPSIKVIKDVAAGAVVISIASAFICGLIIFMPYIFNLVNL